MDFKAKSNTDHSKNKTAAFPFLVFRGRGWVWLGGKIQMVGMEGLNGLFPQEIFLKSQEST